MWLAIVKVVGGLALLITSCDLFVDNAVVIAKSFGVNDAFISLTLIFESVKEEKSATSESKTSVIPRFLSPFTISISDVISNCGK